MPRPPRLNIPGAHDHSLCAVIIARPSDTISLVLASDPSHRFTLRHRSFSSPRSISAHQASLSTFTSADRTISHISQTRHHCFANRSAPNCSVPMLTRRRVLFRHRQCQHLAIPVSGPAPSHHPFIALDRISTNPQLVLETAPK
jgi:hypothetical protein